MDDVSIMRTARIARIACDEHPDKTCQRCVRPACAKAPAMDGQVLAQSRQIDTLEKSQ